MWEGNGKEILKVFGMGGKLEGINVYFQRKMRKGRKKLGKVSKIWQKLAPGMGRKWEGNVKY